jgi:hypothetical protein
VVCPLSVLKNRVAAHTNSSCLYRITTSYVPFFLYKKITEDVSFVKNMLIITILQNYGLYSRRGGERKHKIFKIKLDEKANITPASMITSSNKTPLGPKINVVFNERTSYHRSLRRPWDNIWLDHGPSHVIGLSSCLV